MFPLSPIGRRAAPPPPLTYTHFQLDMDYGFLIAYGNQIHFGFFSLNDHMLWMLTLL